MSRKFIISFLLTLIILFTLMGLFVAGYRTKSALEPIKTPFSLVISENGDSYLLSFSGKNYSISRKNAKKIINFFKNEPVFMPLTGVISEYIADKVPIFYRL